MPFSLAQQKALALLPKVTGLTSIVFSSLIVFSVWRDKAKRRNPYHRLLAGISLVDISASFWLGLSTWPITRDSGVLWAVGTDATCRLQGFFTQFGISSSFYNASLSIYYVLVIRYGWKEHQIQRIEPLLHGIPILWALGTSIAGLPLNIFGNANLWWCWISPKQDVYRWSFFYGPLWLMIVIVTVNCLVILLYVRRTEQASDKYSFESQETARTQMHGNGGEEHGSNTDRRQALRRTQSSTDLTLTRKIAVQSFLYAGAFYLNWFALSLTRLLQTTTGKVYFPLLLIASITVPMQGLPNFIVYLRPMFLKMRRERPSEGIFNWMLGSLQVGEAAFASEVGVAGEGVSELNQQLENSGDDAAVDAADVAA